jgi:hypothetical protein
MEGAMKTATAEILSSLENAKATAQRTIEANARNAERNAEFRRMDTSLLGCMATMAAIAALPRN